MKKTRFTETQIVSILKKQEAGIPTKEIFLSIIFRVTQNFDNHKHFGNANKIRGNKYQDN